MPYTNGMGSPKWVYRVDTRPPEVVFREGFSPWGNNPNYFGHILGTTLGSTLPREEASFLISTSDSPDSAIRFFGSMMFLPFIPPNYYLYQIRADENVYSALRTACYYLERFGEPNFDWGSVSREVAYTAVLSIFRDFAYQREWINAGPINPSRIHSAWLLDSTPINPNHIRHQPDTVYHIPRINEPEIFNQNYIDAPTHANDLPFAAEHAPIVPQVLSVPDNLLEADASGGLGVSLGFACNFNSGSKDNQRSKRAIDPYQHCYFDRGLVKRSLKNPKTKSQLFSSVYYSPMFLIGAQSQKKYFLNWFNDLRIQILSYTKAGLLKPKNILYDQHARFLTLITVKDIGYALTLEDTQDVTIKKVKLKIAVINDPRQKFGYEKITTAQDFNYFRIVSRSLDDFALHRKTDDRDDAIYMLRKGIAHSGYEELYLVIDTNLSDSCLLLKQRSESNLIDLGLSWFYKKQNYIPIPETGYSKAAAPVRKSFFYDLNTCKILYIRENAIFALYNKRSDAYTWDWIRWAPSNLEDTNDLRYKWTILANKFYDNIYDLNLRNIRSLFNNDWLRVVVRGSNWGSFYTTKFIQGINSIALFSLLLPTNI